MNPFPFDIETSVGFLIAKAHQRMFAWFREELAPHGVTPPQFALLAFLAKEDGISQTTLVEKSEIDRTTLGGLIDRLEQAGTVRREADPHDRRASLVYLTDEGRQLIPELITISLRARQCFMAKLSSDEYSTLCALLNKVRSCDVHKERKL